MFNIKDPSTDIQWRNLILFGKNSATYKFAFAKTLLELLEQEKTIITLDDMVEPYSKYMLEHIKSGFNQGNNGKFITSLKDFQTGSIELSELLSITKSEGFSNVIDAFQNVSGGSILKPFYKGKYTGLKTSITLTDELFTLKDAIQLTNLNQEVEARWRLVETAWNLKVSVNNLAVTYDELDGSLYIQSDQMKRVDVSNARDALSGYQKGKCFYCRNDYSLIKNSPNICHVDHFLPHIDKLYHTPANINGVWNLVLACNTCNGASEKGVKVPTDTYLNRLHNRNEHYITSKHPLAETIVNQTGNTKDDRISFLKKHYQIALDNRIVTWQPSETYNNDDLLN